MLRNNAKLIYQYLKLEEFVTADELAKKVKLSNRTVRSYIKEMRITLEKYGINVISKPRFGYKLEIFDIDLYKKSQILSERKTPIENKERERYLMELLVSEESYLRIDDISELFYVSRGTISRILKTIEGELNKFNISLQRKANYGIKIKGKEIDIRRFIEETLAIFSSKRLELELSLKTDERINIILKIIRETIRKYDIYVSEVSYLRLVASLIVQINRIEMHRKIKMKKESLENVTSQSWRMIEDIASRFLEELTIDFCEGEKVYLYLNFMSKGVFNFEQQNILLENSLDNLVDEMLDEVNRELFLNFSEDFELRRQLIQHLVSLNTRIKYNFYFDNPLIDEIKKKYVYAFNIASQSIVALVKKYNKYIPQDEVGYLALIFQLAIERLEKKIKKSNILIVCASGRGSSQLLKYKYRQEFSDYINKLYVCDIYQLKYFDFSAIDYLFTTVPLEDSFPVPVYEMSLFLETDDIVRIKNILSINKIKGENQFYKRGNFIANLEAKNKFEAIEKIIQLINAKYKLSQNLYDSIITRENMASTEFGNYIAMPHTMETFSKKTIVYVAILSEAILWNKKEVQVIILTVIGRESEEDMQTFYELTTDLFYNKQGIERLIEERSYSCLLSLVNKE
ncbi:MAG: BglG family transcription antiterminator [Lactovum sp.]